MRKYSGDMLANRLLGASAKRMVGGPIPRIEIAEIYGAAEDFSCKVSRRCSSFDNGSPKVRFRKADTNNTLEVELATFPARRARPSQARALVRFQSIVFSFPSSSFQESGRSSTSAAPTRPRA